MPLLRPLPAHLGLILPLCTASAQLGLSLASLPLFAAFLSPKKDSQGNLTKISGTPLSHFLASYSAPLASTNLILTLMTVASGLLSFRWLRAHQTLETGQVGWWYAVGVAFAGVQMGFAPLVAPGMLRIVGQVEEGKREAEVQGENEKDMATLFFVYLARTVTTQREHDDACEAVDSSTRTSDSWKKEKVLEVEVLRDETTDPILS
ncbi:hypothetical protein B0A48_02457 [Cryoendolithus antarcticus]|uniref:Uncharacterized protein n=1 Tax=Cryoendolithus antarcticus TaxID=1507870 RepID=A0A1V8TNM8_9PEZI|nr:hypothetical protein B0A48_02457 [Cryoendolithus antarcticus]